MTGLRNLIRDELTDQAASGALPTGLGARVIATVSRRRRRRQMVGAAAVTLAAVSVATAVTPRATTSPPATGPGPNAVFAYRNSDHAGGPSTWRVLNPATGEYRTLTVDTVTAPTADLRRVAVAATAANGRPGIAVYDTVTGQTTALLDLPEPLGTPPRISPDGRYIVAAAATSSANPAEQFATLMLFDLTGGPAEVIGLDPDVAAAARTLTFKGYKVVVSAAGTGLAWHPDSRHLLLGNTVLDLRGRRVETLPVPENMVIVALRPDGDAVLAGAGVDTPGPGFGYVVLSADGDIAKRVFVPWCATGATATPSSVLVSPPASPDPSEATSPDPSDPGTDPSLSADPSPSADPSLSADPSPSADPGPDVSATSYPDVTASPFPDVSVSPDPYASMSPGPDHSMSVEPRYHCWRTTYLDWRGHDGFLVTDGARLIAVDIRTGEHRVVRPAIMPPDPVDAVVVSADQLSDQARQGVSF